MNEELLLHSLKISDCEEFGGIMNLRQVNEIPVLETERLVLKALTAGDTPLLYNFNSNPESLEYIAGEPYGYETSRRTFSKVYEGN